MKGLTQKYFVLYQIRQAELMDDVINFIKLPKENGNLKADKNIYHKRKLQIQTFKNLTRVTLKMYFFYSNLHYSWEVYVRIFLAFSEKLQVSSTTIKHNFNKYTIRLFSITNDFLFAFHLPLTTLAWLLNLGYKRSSGDRAIQLHDQYHAKYLTMKKAK